MKLSDIKGERVFDVIADLISPIANIASDKDAMELFQKKKVPQDTDVKTFLIQRLTKALPILLKNHKQDIISVLSTIEGCSANDYAENLTLSTLMRDCADLLNDKTFMELFISAQTEELSSVSVQTISEEKV